LNSPIIADLFIDSAFALARREVLQNVSELRKMGEFEPVRVSSKEMK
jgi:fructose 1,6-bisphosphatase